VLIVRLTISDEMRDVIETEWPDLAAKILPPKDSRPLQWRRMPE
jgi:hypothetical protein